MDNENTCQRSRCSINNKGLLVSEVSLLDIPVSIVSSTGDLSRAVVGAGEMEEKGKK